LPNANDFSGKMPFSNSERRFSPERSLLVLDRENNSGANYTVEIWDDKGHQLPLMSEVTLTVIGVANKAGGMPAFRAVIAPPAQAGGPTGGA